MINYNKSVGLFVLSFACVSSVTLWAMDIDKEIAKLKDQRSQMLRELEKKAGGDSTMAYRRAAKANKEQLSKFNRDIVILGKLKKLDSKL